MLEDKRLIIFGSRIGLGFSGGSNATILLFEHIIAAFKETYVICHELGELPYLDQVKLIHWEKESDILPLLKSLHTKNSIFYGDFQDAIYLVKAKLPFFFTYHDNWPEQKKLNIASYFQSFRMEARYAQIFKAAEHVFSVTEHKRAYIGRYTKAHSLYAMELL